MAAGSAWGIQDEAWSARPSTSGVETSAAKTRSLTTVMRSSRVPLTRRWKMAGALRGLLAISVSGTARPARRASASWRGLVACAPA